MTDYTELIKHIAKQLARVNEHHIKYNDYEFNEINYTIARRCAKEVRDNPELKKTQPELFKFLKGLGTRLYYPIGGTYRKRTAKELMIVLEYCWNNNIIFDEADPRNGVK